MIYARRALITLAAIGALLAVLYAIPTHPTAPCRIPGHARTTTVECENR